LSQLALPEPAKKPKVPQKIAARVKGLLQANKRSIRFWTGMGKV